MESLAALIVSLILLAVMFHYNLVRLFCFLVAFWLVIATMATGLILFYALPGATTIPGHPMFYLPCLVSPFCLAARFGVAVLVDQGKPDIPENRAPLRRTLPWLIGGLVVHLAGAAMVLTTIYVNDNDWSRESLFAGLYILFGATATGSLLLVKTVMAGKIIRWLSLLTAESVAVTPLVICMIYIYAVPDKAATRTWPPGVPFARYPLQV